MSDLPCLLVLAEPLTPDGTSAEEALKSGLTGKLDIVPLSAEAASSRQAFIQTIQDVKKDHTNIVAILGNRWRFNAIQPLDAELFAPLSGTLQFVTSGGAGYNHADIDDLAKAGVSYANTPDAPRVATANWATLQCLMMLRRGIELHQFVATHQWKGTPGPPGLFAKQLSKSTVGILGYGRIGQTVAQRLAAFDIIVIYHNRRPVPDASAHGARYEKTMDSLLEKSDVVLVLVPLSAQTHHLIGEKQLGICKKGTCIVNTGRGGLIDEDALLQALDAGHIAGAALDVFENEPRVKDGFFGRDNVFFSPHLAAAEAGTVERMEVELVDNVREFLETGSCSKTIPPHN